MDISSRKLDFRKDFLVAAGPCAIESYQQLSQTAHWVKQSGAGLLRGGVFKLRTTPEKFQGLRKKALHHAQEVKNTTGLPFISEISDPRHIEAFLSVVDVFQVGTRHMHNYELLKELGQINRPVLLKRGFCSRVEEWLGAADYLVKYGNPNVILCERGIRTFETVTRNTLDLNAVAYVKKHTAFPVFVDPSHGTGNAPLVRPLSLAALACGADGLLIEVHPEPQKALSDGPQSLNFQEFGELMDDLKKLAHLMNRRLASATKTPELIPSTAHL